MCRSAVAAGELVAVIGASGSGRSTLHRRIVGLSRFDVSLPSRVEVPGREVQCNGQLARDVRSVSQHVAFSSTPVGALPPRL